MATLVDLFLASQRICRGESVKKGHYLMFHPKTGEEQVVGARITKVGSKHGYFLYGGQAMRTSLLDFEFRFRSLNRNGIQRL